MLYLSHAHKPSATVQSLVLPDFLPSGPCLAVVYHSSISFLALPGNSNSDTSSASTLQEVASVEVNARILAVQAATGQDDSLGNDGISSVGGLARRTKRLLVLTDHHHPRVVVLLHAGSSHGDADILTESSLLLDEAARSPAELGLGLFVEPGDLQGSDLGVGQRFAAAHTHNGLLSLIPISSGQNPASSNAGSSTTSRRRSSRISEADTRAEDVNPTQAIYGRPDTAQAFGARLPHPTLISSAFLHPRDELSPATLALLSLSSVPSRIPGLGQQCLPVLSFHAIDQKLQELRPLAWGPPRRPPAPEAEASQRAGASRRPSRSRNMPGSYGNEDEDVGDEERQAEESRQTRKKHGPSAMGKALDSAALLQREEQWAKAPLTQAHVPLPFIDALGAHLVHALPASAGGGVIVFSETSILLVPPPSSASQPGARPDATSGPSESGSAAGKRRKGSSSVGSPRSRQASVSGKAEVSQDVLSTSPTAPSSRSNENGKRRRSSAALVTSPPSSPSASRGPPRKSVHLLRTTLPFPVQVSAATTMIEADGTSAIVEDSLASPHRAYIHVLFACSSGSLELLKVKLEGSSSSAHHEQTWRPIGLSVEHVGSIPQASGPNALSYLGEGFVHVSSTTGDAVLYRVEPEALAAGPGGPSASEDAASDVQMISPPTSPSQAAVPPPFSSFSETGNLPSAGRLVEIQRWNNLGPILDFTVDDGAGGDPASASSAQARIVTCSGSGPTSSLRVVRTGVGMEDMATLALANVHRIWGLQTGAGTDRVSTIIALGYESSTGFLGFQQDGSTMDLTAAINGAGVACDLPPLAVSSVETSSGSATDSASTSFIVVNRSQVSLVEVRSGVVNLLASWQPSGSSVGTAKGTITIAAVNELGQVLLSLHDQTLVYLQAAAGTGFREVKRISLDQQVSCMDVTALHPDMPAEHCAVGFWGSLSAQIFTLPDLKAVGQSSFAQERLPALPRSIILHRFQAADHGSKDPDAPGGSAAGIVCLLIGLGDGTLISYRLSLPNSDSYSDTVGLFDQKVVSLGTRALRLERIQTSEGVQAVSVAGERPSVVFVDSKRITYSSVKYKGVRSATTLYAANQPVLNAFALPEGLQIASVGSLQKLDIRTIPLGCEQPLAIIQHAASSVFGVVTWTFLPQGTATKGLDARGSVRLFDHGDLALLDEAQLEPDERPNCIETVTLSNQQTYLVVGTGFVKPDASETSSGRLIGFEVSSGTAAHPAKQERKLKLAFEEAVRGNVYAIASIHDRIAVANNSQVGIYELATAESKQRELLSLRQVDEWGCAFVACTLSKAGEDRLVVGDALRSMNVLHVDPEDGRIREIARDCDPFWTTATEMIDEASQTFVGADVALNMYTTQRVQLSPAEKRRIQKARDSAMESGQQPREQTNRYASMDGYAHLMQRQAVWHYGDMVNKFKKGCLTSKLGTGGGSASGQRVADPRIVFATAAGAIGVLAQLDPEVGPVISQLQRNILAVVEANPSFSPSVHDHLTPRYLGVVGAIPSSVYRTLRTDHRVQVAAGFVDGEVIKMFSNGRLTSDVKRMVLDGPNGAVEKIDKPTEAERWAEALGQLV